MEKIWASLENTDGKDSPRAIRGRLFLLPNKEDIGHDSKRSPGNLNLDVWGSHDDKTMQVKIMEDNCQLARPSLQSSFGESLLNEQLMKAKVSRSQSFSDNVIKMDSLMPPDPRRFSFASNESVISSASSLSDIWSNDPPEQKRHFPQMFKMREFPQEYPIWGESELGVNQDKHQSIEENSQLNSDYFQTITSSNEFDRRSSGFSSDSERSSRRPSSNYDRRYSRLSLESSRRDSDLSWLSERRSSGFVTDTDRRDSSSSNSSIGQLTRQNVVSVVQPGMEHVPQWLKTLRLHKYTDLIMGMSYAEMVDLNEEKLEKLNVTKGARRKIVLSIQKLMERPKLLTTIDSEIESENCDVKNVLMELESVLKSPIIIEDEDNNRSRHNSARDSGAEVSEDEEQDSVVDLHCGGRQLVEMIMNTLRKACSLILLSQHTDTKNVSLLTSLLDICLSRSCYLPHQKQLLLSWKHKLYSIWGPLPPAHQSVLHKEKTFQTPKNLQFFPSNPLQSSYGQQAAVHTERDDWAPHSHLENKEMLSVPTLSDSLTQRKQYPFLLQRKSAPNIETFGSFSSPVSFRKRYSMQDGITFSAADNQQSFGQDYSLPTIQPYSSKRTLVRTDQEPLSLTRSDCDWKFNKRVTEFRSSDFLQEKQYFEKEFNDKTSESHSSVESHPGHPGHPGHPTRILVTGVDSLDSVDPPSDAELDTRLESLCLSVTEQALS